MDSMTLEMSSILGDLIGLALWDCRRAADMATFQFGRRISVQDFYGRSSEVGEYALHVQCAWRIFNDSGVIVASADLHYPAGTLGDDTVSESFDWRHDRSRRDELLEILFKGDQLVVRNASLGMAGSARIEFGGGKCLELFPDDSVAHEHWRLFATQIDGRELVVSG